MQHQDLHDFLLKLYDFTDHVADSAVSDPDFRNNRILTLIFIEKYFDLIGREEISTATKEGAGSDESMTDAHERTDILRKRIGSLIDNCQSTEEIRFQDQY